MRFLLDVMLGRLATYLRMAGHDAAYALDRGVESDDDVLAIARDEARTLVTRDVELSARARDAILVRETGIEAQLRTLRGMGVELSLDRPVRCSRCNATVEPVPHGEETPTYAPATGEFDLWRCTSCGQYYWRGSHWDDVRDRLASL